MPVLEVGKPYLPDRARLEPRAEYNCRGGQHELLLCLSGLTEREVEAVRKGEAELGLVIWGDVLFFLYRFGEAIQWSDAPYSWHLVPAGERELPEPPATTETRALLSVVLVDADRNVVRALGAVTLSPDFTRELHRAIRRQAARPWPAEDYDAQLRRAYERWPDTEAMLAAAVARCLGGA